MKKKTYEEVQEQFLKHGCKLISKEYKNNSTKMLFECSCGDISEIALNQFLKAPRCRKCGIERMRKSKDQGQQPCRYCGSDKDLMNRKKHGNVCRVCYNEKHAEFQKKNCREYYLIHKDKRDKYSREKRQENPKLHNYISNRSYHKTRLEVLAHYSPDLSCVRCGFNEHISALSIDHINGNGNKMRRNLHDHGRICNWLKKNGLPEGFQVLCMNCQFIKRYENNESVSHLNRHENNECKV